MSKEAKAQSALKLALEALEADELDMVDDGSGNMVFRKEQAITAIKEALAQPEFIKHEVENADDWSEWVCPDPKGYLMKCCDCGLVHEAEFGVVRYKSETEREDCDRVDDPNLQAVFRMRRSEQWSPEDTAHRAGGMPMEQPQQEPVVYMSHNKKNFVSADDVGNSVPNWTDYYPIPLYTIPPPCPTCEALARTVMLDQTSHDNFKPDWDTQAVLVEEQQRMSKRILEFEAFLERQTALLERQTARIVDLQTHIENFDGEDR
jgi:hypothetical protein